MYADVIKSFCDQLRIIVGCIDRTVILHEAEQHLVDHAADLHHHLSDSFPEAQSSSDLGFNASEVHRMVPDRRLHHHNVVELQQHPADRHSASKEHHLPIVNYRI